jgi:MSHA biogenesis protein MshO
MTASRAGAAGFTLLEVVIVMAISAIVAVFVVFFLATPVEAYFAQTRRADLVDSADRILRGVAADVRSALPNSIRQSAAGGVVALELLATGGVARYYGAGDKQYIGGAQQLAEELSIGAPDQSFYTLDLFAPSNAGNYLAVNNQGLPGAYAMAGVMTPFSSIGAPLPPPAVVPGEAWVQLPGAGFDFGTASPTHSVFVVTGPVSYLCDTNAQTLQRYTGYTPAAAQPATNAQLLAAGATVSLVAQNVSACSVRLVAAPASGKFNQLVILDITLSSSGEILPVFDEVATEYVP